MLTQNYLKLLLQAIGSKFNPPKSPAQARVAARCMCGMLSALHHFNYSSDLLQAVVPLMVSQDAQLRQLSCAAIREVLVNDEEGKVAVEAVQLVRLSGRLMWCISRHTVSVSLQSCMQCLYTTCHCIVSYSVYVSCVTAKCLHCVMSMCVDSCHLACMLSAQLCVLLLRP